MGVKHQQMNLTSYFDGGLMHPKYPILAKIARDILAILISTVTSEFAFSNGGRILDPFKSSLSPLTVEALICTQDWLKGNEDLDYENFIEIFDEHGKCL
jgi:hypothetical protein